MFKKFIAALFVVALAQVNSASLRKTAPTTYTYDNKVIRSGNSKISGSQIKLDDYKNFKGVSSINNYNSASSNMNAFNVNNDDAINTNVPVGAITLGI